MLRSILIAALLFGLGACQTPAEDDSAPEAVDPAAQASALDTLFASYRPTVVEPMAFDKAAASQWVDSLMQALTPQQKIGQLFIVHLPGPAGASVSRAARQAIEAHQVGGFLMPRLMPPGEIAELTRRLQDLADVPLFIAADYERGVGRFSNPMTELPSNMAIGATREVAYAAAAGQLTALESHAVGINLLFAPVVDVNNNPANPIINIRSYGGRAELVGRMADAFVRAAERHGVLTTLKHFPGHGNTSVDTHTSMATVTGSRAALDSVELKPYRMVLGGEHAPAAVMAAHLWAEALEPEPLPSTFSQAALKDLLRGELGFEGVIITDDITMGALQNDFSFSERMIRPLKAGADIVLMPADLPGAIAEVRQALGDGRLSDERLDTSVRRILEAKARAGLYNKRAPEPDLTAYFLEEKRGQSIAQAIADASITLLKESEVLPLEPQRQTIALVELANYTGSESIATAMDTLEASLGAPAYIARADADVAAGKRQDILAATEDADVVLIALFLRLRAGRGEAGLFAGQRRLVEALVARDVPVVLATFGNPYAASAFADADALLVAYDQTLASIQAAVDVLQGTQPPRGELPIRAEPFAYGSGL